MENNRDFKGVWFPAELWLDNRLNMLEKGIFAEIDSLDDGYNGCFASNEYLANFCGCSERKVSDAISKLIKLDYIYIKSFDGRTRYIRSRFTKDAKQGSKICESEMQDLQQNNIIYNSKLEKENICINTNTKEIEILNYLNEKAGTRYRAVESNLRLIRGRLKDYTVDELKKVVDNKVRDWKGTNMQQYLRPETLFRATKFESYMNGLEVKQVQKRDYDERNYSQQELSSVVTSVDNLSIDDI